MDAIGVGAAMGLSPPQGCAVTGLKANHVLTEGQGQSIKMGNLGPVNAIHVGAAMGLSSPQ